MNKDTYNGYNLESCFECKFAILNLSNTARIAARLLNGYTPFKCTHPEINQSTSYEPIIKFKPEPNYNDERHCYAFEPRENDENN